MRKKLLGAQEALDGGVSRVCIGSESLMGVLNGEGTTIVRVGRATTRVALYYTPIACVARKNDI
jgi:acetylglutamate/LysW-gamma-L-alpha-aminoadipate kinase